MPVRIVCPHCLQALRLPEELYEGPVQCPRCKGGIALRWHPRGLNRFEEGDLQPVADPTRRCRFCGVPRQPGTEPCTACGQQ